MNIPALWRTHPAPLLAVASAGVHALPFWLYGADPLGYDAGFYRRYLIQPLTSFPRPSVPGLGSDALIPRALLDILSFLHIPADIALYGAYGACFVLLPVLAFLYLRAHLGNRGALIAGLFVVLSSVGYTAYWYVLLKNAFALLFIMLAFMAFERRALWPLIALDIAIALTHKTSAIIYLFTLLILLIIAEGRRREVVLHIFITGAVFALANLGLAHSVIRSVPAALFLEWRDYLWLSAPFIILLPASFMAIRHHSIPHTLIAFLLASFLFPIAHLPFYERIFVFSDLALCMLAAYGADYLMKNLSGNGAKLWLSFGALCIAGGLLVGNLVAQVRDLTPLVPESSIRSIEATGEIVPSSAIILTTANEAPWYEGWTYSHIAAPGMLYDTHDLDEWNAFWDATSTAEKISFLSSFPQPLYISTAGRFEDLIGTPPSCLTPLTPQLLRDDCSKTY